MLFKTEIKFRLKFSNKFKHKQNKQYRHFSFILYGNWMFFTETGANFQLPLQALVSTQHGSARLKMEVDINSVSGCCKNAHG